MMVAPSYYVIYEDAGTQNIFDLVGTAYEPLQWTFEISVHRELQTEQILILYCNV